MTEEEKKDEELSIDFSKITKFFKGGDKKEESESESSEEINIDFEGALDFIKKHKTIFVYLTLAILLGMTFFSRVQNVPHLEGKYLLSPDDPYVFLRYATDIANSNLPANDTLRYYPEGIDITHENLGSAYLAGYLLKFIWIFNPSATMYDIGAYYAPILLVIGIAAFFFLAKEILENEAAALTASGLLAFSIAIFFRTSAGFLEKEPLFLPLLVLGFLFFLRAYKQKEMSKWVYINGILGGIFTGLAGFASGLFFFVEVYAAVFFVIEVLLEKVNKQKLMTFGIWFASMYILLLIVTTKYGDLTNFITFVQFQIPAAALLLGLIAVYVKKPAQLKVMPDGIFHIIAGVLLVLLIGGIISIFKPGFLAGTVGFVLDRIESPTAVDRFTQSVSENQPPTFLGGGSSWWTTFGVSILVPGGGYVSVGLIFILFFLGGLIMFYKEFGNFRYATWITLIFGIFLSAVVFEHFSADQKYQWVNAIFGDQTIYFAIFGITMIVFMFLEHSKHEHLEKINSTYLLMLVWFIIATMAANGSVRLFFMLAFPAAVMAAYFIKWSSEFLSHKVNKNLNILPYAFGAVIIIMMFWVVTVSNESMYPGLQPYYDALEWAKNNTPTNAVFTSWWDYGYIIQTIGERATVGDPGNFYTVRNYNTGGYLFNSFNNTDTLAYLNKYSKPSYWFIISEDVPKFYQIARLGALSNLTGSLPANGTLGLESYFSTYALMSQETGIKPNSLGVYPEYPMIAIMEPLSGPSQVLKDFRVGNMLYSGEATFILRVIVPIANNSTGPTLVQVFNSATQKMEVFKAQCACEKEVGCHDVNNTDNMTLVPTCIYMQNGGALNIPYKSKDVLFTQLYVLGKTIPGYDLVYSSNTPLDLLAMAGRATNIQIYKFNYTALEENKGW